MLQAALGFRAHSGWAALVAVAGSPHAIEVIERRIITVIDPAAAGARQPYHYVEHRDVRAAEEHLAKCAAVADRLAAEGLRGAVAGLTRRGHRVAGAALLLASGRPLPSLDRILASHALIHTAEGEFFRDVFRRACEHLRIPLAAIRERDLVPAEGLRRPPDPPWAQDQKLAAFAACRILAPDV